PCLGRLESREGTIRFSRQPGEKSRHIVGVPHMRNAVLREGIRLGLDSMRSAATPAKRHYEQEKRPAQEPRPIGEHAVTTPIISDRRSKSIAIRLVSSENFRNGLRSRIGAAKGVSGSPLGEFGCAGVSAPAFGSLIYFVGSTMDFSAPPALLQIVQERLHPGT